MFDLDCHILPGVDDGPASLEEALDLARFCVHDGITHVAATPHRHRHLRLLRADILPPVARFQEEGDYVASYVSLAPEVRTEAPSRRPHRFAAASRGPSGLRDSLRDGRQARG